MKALRPVAGALLRIAAAVAAFVVIILAVTWGAHGVIMLLKAIP